MEDVVRILVARHPETEANVARRFVGTGDTAYTPLGRRQAAELTEAVVAFAPDAVFSSPRRRCVEVASAAAERSGAALTTTEALGEMDFGRIEGLTYGEATALGLSMDLLGGPSEEVEANGGEPWAHFEERVRTSLPALLAAGPRVAVITHSGVVRSLLTSALDLPSDSAWRFAVAPASVSVLTVGDDFAVLEAFGLTPEAARAL